MCDVAITKTKLRVGLKGQPPILEGELSEPVKADDCMWNIADDVMEVRQGGQGRGGQGREGEGRGG